MSRIGTVMKTAEHAFGGVWSVAEMAVCALRVGEILRDPHREAVIKDIRERGFYVPIAPNELGVTIRDRSVIGRNPYQRLGHGKDDRIVAKFVRAKKERKSKHLVVMCHCYGVPFPRVMERWFGLHEIEHADVVYNIMNHHYRGSFSLWPGTGLASGRLSHFIENMRSSITGVRALILALMAERGYDKVTVIGFSIGGQIGLHLCNSAPVDNAVLYCPVASLHDTATELGLMRWMKEPVTRVMGVISPHFEFEDLQLMDPLRHPMQTPPENMHVIVQRYDALAPVHQVRAIRSKYPKVKWYEFHGTHIVPAGMTRFQRIIRDVLDEEPDAGMPEPSNSEL